MRIIKITVLVLVFISAGLYGDDNLFSDYGSVLFTENCMSCHSMSSYKVKNPEKEDVDQLTEEIEFRIYTPGSAMMDLDYLNRSEIKEISRFLVYGAHVKNWVSEDYHGDYAEDIGSSVCMECHDNDELDKVDIPSCTECH